MGTWSMTEVAFQVSGEKIGYSFNGTGQLAFYMRKNIYNWNLVSHHTQKMNSC